MDLQLSLLDSSLDQLIVKCREILQFWRRFLTASVSGCSRECRSASGADRCDASMPPRGWHSHSRKQLALVCDWSYTEQPIAIMDRSVKTLKNQAIPLVLVSWNRHSPVKRLENGKTSSANVTPNFLIPELVNLHLTLFCLVNPYLFSWVSLTLRNFKDEIFVRWVGCNSPFPGYVLRYVF